MSSTLLTTLLLPFRGIVEVLIWLSLSLMRFALLFLCHSDLQLDYFVPGLPFLLIYSSLVAPVTPQELNGDMGGTLKCAEIDIKTGMACSAVFKTVTGYEGLECALPEGQEALGLLGQGQDCRGVGLQASSPVGPHQEC